MRTSKQEKEKLKEKILVEALPFLKRFGNDGAPVDQIMKQVGLTSGALYSHFRSKEDFFAQVVLRELDRLIEKYTADVRKQGGDALARLIESYLSELHVNSVGEGCVFTALGADLHRQKPTVRALYEQKIEMLFQVLAQALPRGTPEERLERVRFVFSSLVGTLVFARSLKSAEAVENILTASRRQLLRNIV